jgi:hypothetical protein
MADSNAEHGQCSGVDAQNERFNMNPEIYPKSAQ